MVQSGFAPPTLICSHRQSCYSNWLFAVRIKTIDAWGLFQPKHQIVQGQVDFSQFGWNQYLNALRNLFCISFASPTFKWSNSIYFGSKLTNYLIWYNVMGGEPARMQKQQINDEAFSYYGRSTTMQSRTSFEKVGSSLKSLTEFSDSLFNFCYLSFGFRTRLFFW